MTVGTRLFDEDTVPEAAKPLLAASKESFGMIPDLHALMAASPAHLEGYQTLRRLVVEGTDFTPAERTVVWMTINVEHRCHYCVPAHTSIAQAEKIDLASSRRSAVSRWRACASAGKSRARQ